MSQGMRPVQAGTVNRMCGEVARLPSLRTGCEATKGEIFGLTGNRSVPTANKLFNGWLDKVQFPPDCDVPSFLVLVANEQNKWTTLNLPPKSIYLRFFGMRCDKQFVQQGVQKDTTKIFPHTIHHQT